MEEEELKRGYKRTEEGIIPENWEIKRLDELFAINAAGDLKKDNFSETKDEKHPYPIYSNSLTEKGLYGYSSEYEYNENCITVTARGTLGVAVPRDHKFNAIIRVLVLSPIKKLNCVFMSEYINNKISFSIESTGVPQLTTPQISRYKIVYPPPEEQFAIAQILSEISKLIQKLDMLMLKKKNIKKVVMQELLTQKRRLPSFNDDWEIDVIKNHAEISTGKKDTQDKVDSGKYPFFVRSQEVERINTYSFDGEAVLTAGDGDIGKIFHYINGKFDYHQRVYKISKFDDKLDGYFFYLFFSQNFYNRIMSLTAKSTVDSIRMDMIADMEIQLPSKEEQFAISKVLSDMVLEIEKLKQKKEKLKFLKMGMLQQLLTGRIRLV